MLCLRFEPLDVCADGSTVLSNAIKAVQFCLFVHTPSFKICFTVLFRSTFSKECDRRHQTSRRLEVTSTSTTTRRLSVASTPTRKSSTAKATQITSSSAAVEQS